MSTTLLAPQAVNEENGPSVQSHVEAMIDARIASLPTPAALTSAGRRGIIARYSSVLEGNFIYWMTSALLAVKAEEARPIILDNLNEEIRDSHPVMLRKFAIAAHAFPTDADALVTNDELNRVRVFLGRMSGVQTLLSMAYLEGFIQKFMSYLAELAVLENSTELEYTDVHGVCDIGHTDGLFRAAAIEMQINPLAAGADPFEGVHLIDTLVQRIIEG